MIDILVLLCDFYIFFFFFFKQKTAYEMRISDWSSDVCSSDLLAGKSNKDCYGKHESFTAGRAGTMSRTYFGTDGIRGRTNQWPMTAELEMKVGMAAGKPFQRGTHRHRGGLGHDTRLSGSMVENALVAGRSEERMGGKEWG